MLALFAAVAGIALKLWGMFKGGPKASAEAVAAGNAAQERTVAQVNAASAQAQDRMAQATVDAPQTQAGVVDALNKGEF